MDSIIACVPKINHQIRFRTLIKQQDKRQLRKQSTKLAKELKNKGVAMMTEEDTREKFASANVQDVERYSLPSVMKEMEQIYRSYM